MGLVVGQAKYIIYPYKRMHKLESELPDHRELKQIPHEIKTDDFVISSSEGENYLIDFKPKQSGDDYDEDSEGISIDYDGEDDEYDCNDEDGK